ncbi:flagellar motor switch protein FliG [Virgibacillus alimentarius]|uniref:Flagellar motor switch protein FliG n=1 Tax=Virgibacillus alimentarius TaxID=698769 RepID=A0ABS4S3Y9_9BACI|nr:MULTISPECIES: flagellar motor switch protein FliG [Virgibacillus]MBP2256196.1 flagellar motor switch protein FliG [Virgibacillus alimentarius]HLR66143.1 flagellar motor switch protein FliG [Virgibacillus sp.]
MTKYKRLTGKQKAAILLITLGPDVSAQIYKHLNEEEIEKLSLEISSVKKVDSRQKEDTLEQFYQIALAQDYISQGGVGYAKTVLEKAFGKQEATNIINRLTSSLQVRPFEFARKAEPQQLLNFIQTEHPQTIALILSYLDSEQAGQILSDLPQEMQADIAKRIATMDSTSPEIISQVEQVLERNVATSLTEDYTQTGGIQAVVEVLNGVDRSTERTILDALEVQDPELSNEIKKRMFVFEDIVILDNRAIQKVIREVEDKDLQLSLKIASDEVKEIIFKNMSERMAETYKEDMKYMGPVRLKEVEDAQTSIVSVIRKLEETGEIVIARGGGDDIIV